MPTVYITSNSGHDYSAATHFGQLKFLSNGKMDPFKVNDIHRTFSEALADSNPEDYILITGLQVMNVVACSIMATKHGKLNILQYHGGSHRYKDRTIVFNKIEDDPCVKTNRYRHLLIRADSR